MPDSLTLISADDPQWPALLARTDHDFFHTAAYHGLWDRFGHGRALLAVYGTPDKFVAWPYLLTPIEPPGSDACADVTSVYGYTGPITYNCADDSVFSASAWLRLLECWRDQKVVSVFARMHPILANDGVIASMAAGGAASGPGLVYHGETVGIPLDAPEEETWCNYHKKLRQELRRSQRLGLESVCDPEWRYLQEFLALYYATMERNHAAAFYFFSPDYFESLRQALGEHGGLVVTRYQGQAVAACLMIDYQGIASTHLSASDPKFERQLSPSKLLLHDTQLWARRRRNRVLHLGGGRGSSNEDPLFCFKAAYSPHRYRFSTGRWILNQATYDELSRVRWEQARQSEAELAAGFFPEYRAPFADNARGQGDGEFAKAHGQEICR
jgi:hypothetical protein